MKIDPVTLQSFIAIVEEGSIAKAATRIHLAPSAVSKRIAELESHLHTQLLLRIFATRYKVVFDPASGHKH